MVPRGIAEAKPREIRRQRNVSKQPADNVSDYYKCSIREHLTIDPSPPSSTQRTI